MYRSSYCVFRDITHLLMTLINDARHMTAHRIHVTMIIHGPRLSALMITALEAMTDPSEEIYLAGEAHR